MIDAATLAHGAAAVVHKVAVYLTNFSCTAYTIFI
jgi:hypothetical protein